MRRLLLTSLLALAIPMTAEARRIPMTSLGHSDPTDLSLGHGHSGHHGLALGHGLNLDPGSGFPPGPPAGVPPGPPVGVPPHPIVPAHGHFPLSHVPPVGAPVPEPGTAVLLLGGMLGLAWKSRARH